MPTTTPYRKRYNYARRYKKRNNYRRAGFATRPRMMPRSLAIKRFNQVSTKVFWFKDNNVLQTGVGGISRGVWSTQDIVTNPPDQFLDLCKIYDEFKVLAIYVKLFPANVGTESDTLLFGNNSLLRGDHIVWSDNKADVIPSPINAISDKINTASCRMINPRRPYSRRLFRPTGNPDWGGTSSITQTPDQWVGTINWFCQNTTDAVAPAAPLPLYYWTRMFKVVFRGRIQ